MNVNNNDIRPIWHMGFKTKNVLCSISIILKQSFLRFCSLVKANFFNLPYLDYLLKVVPSLAETAFGTLAPPAILASSSDQHLR